MRDFLPPLPRWVEPVNRAAGRMALASVLVSILLLASRLMGVLLPALLVMPVLLTSVTALVLTVAVWVRLRLLRRQMDRAAAGWAAIWRG